MAVGGNNMRSSQTLAALLRNDKLLDSFWLPESSPALLGPKSMVSFESVGGAGTTAAPPFLSLDKEDNGYEDFDGCFNPPGKKRRLTASQVQFLEKNFEVENKLEPDRKVQLAKELGLQPRQVAIWFQNHRARSKNKRLEKDYDSLKAVYDKLKDEYDNLHKDNQVLQNEVLALKDKLLFKEKGKENSETGDAIKLSVEKPQKPTANTDTKTASNVPMVACIQDDANSAKSDVFDSDSPHYTEGNHSSFIDHVADSSQDEDDNHSKGLLPPPPPFFLKLEDCCYDDLPTNSSNFGFSMEDQPFWSWSY